MFNTLLALIAMRRTPRLVSEDNISIENINKILEATKFAPSFDRIYPYEIHVLTNSLEGRAKKEQLIEYYRCTDNDGSVPDPFTSFEGKEIVQPILSGATFVFVATPSKSPLLYEDAFNKYIITVKDTMMAASYAMLAATSLGYKTGMFGAVTNNQNFNQHAANLFSSNPDSRIVVSVTVANTLVEPASPDVVKQPYVYKNQHAFVYPFKHRKIIASAPVTIL